MFTLAHLSDPHLGSLPAPGLGALLGKRVLGYLSWTYRRKGIHLGAVLTALIADLRNAGPDHVAVTGDITNISLPEEFTRAGVWLHGLGAPNSVSVVPGNHDAYVGVPWDESLGKWADFMSGRTARSPDAEAPIASIGDFPYVRLRDPVAVIGVSTALPTQPFSAAGRIGPEQMQRLERQLETLRGRKLFRVVLIHHPPLPGPAQRRKQLLDSAQFRDCIARAGAELILHGHTHVSGLAKLATPNGHAPVIGVPSASASAEHGGYKDHSRYHLYQIEPDDKGWRLHVEVRGVQPTLDRFATEGRFTLSVPD